jgi:hypothetical protein
MTTLSQAAGAPAPLAPDDFDHLLSPLSLGDLAEFEAWANEKCLADAKAKIKFLADNDALAPEVKQATLAQAFDRTKTGIASALAAATLDGTRKLALLSLRRRKPDITPAEIDQLITVANLADIKRKLDRASGFAEEEEDEQPEKEGARPNAPAAAAQENSSAPPPPSTGPASTTLSPTAA